MKKRFSGPQIVAKLRQADVLIGQAKTVPELCKELEISQQTYYRRHHKSFLSIINPLSTYTYKTRISS